MENELKWEHSYDSRLIPAYRVKERLEAFRISLKREYSDSEAYAVKKCIDIVDGLEGVRVSFVNPSILPDD